MEERMELAEEKLPVESIIMKTDIESKIKEGKSVIITIPVDEECKSSDVYVIPDTSAKNQENIPEMKPKLHMKTLSQGIYVVPNNISLIKQEAKPVVSDPMPHIKTLSQDLYLLPKNSAIKQETKPDLASFPHTDSFAEDVYVVSDNSSPIKQETKPKMDPLRGSGSPEPTIIVNIDDDEEEEDDNDIEEEEEEAEDSEECYENKQQRHKRAENSEDWLVQDVVSSAEAKNAQKQNSQNGPVNVWYVKSVKEENLSRSSYVLEHKSGGISVKNEKKSRANSSSHRQMFHNASGCPENHNRQASRGSKFGARSSDELTIEDDMMEEKIQVCHECSHCFTSLSELEMHMQTHQEGSSWICPDCGKCYYTKSSLDRHLLTHIRNKPLKCPECGKGFKKQIYFEMHLRLHAGEVLFPCTECEKLFGSKASCDRHIRAHKMERPHVCPQCGKGFLYNGCLIRHIRVHTGERPFPCPDCGRCFRQTSALNRHLKTHTGEKPFDCSECGKCFTHQSDLNRHKETHRGNQPIVQCVQNNESSLPTYIIL